MAFDISFRYPERAIVRLWIWTLHIVLRGIVAPSCIVGAKHLCATRLTVIVAYSTLENLFLRFVLNEMEKCCIKLWYYANVLRNAVPVRYRAPTKAVV